MPYEEQFTLSAIPPFRLDLTVWALRRRQKNLIDQWNGKEYTRVLIMQGRAFQILVEQKTEIKLSVTVKSDKRVLGEEEALADILKKMLGVDKDLEQFYRLAEKDTYLQSLAKEFRGIKPPRFPTIFEALVNAIACQQVTLDLGILLLNRLSEKYGKAFAGQYAFPEPVDIYKCSEKDLQSLGFSYQKARAIIELSKQVVEGSKSFEDLETLRNEEIVKRLTTIRGVGRWSAEYVLLRGFGRIDTFPGDDVGAQKNLMLLMNLSHYPNYEEIKNLTKPWEPYAGLVYFHLLLEKLQKKNLV